MKTGKMALLFLVAGAVSVLSTTAWGQLYGGRSLPSSRLGENIGSVTSSSQFTRRAGGGAPTGLLAARFGFNPARIAGGLSPAKLDLGTLRPELVGLRLRSLESFALSRRARFASLQVGSLELSAMLGGEKLISRDDLSQSFFQFVFPFGLRDKPDQYDYGYYCLTCLQRGHLPDPGSFLSEFSEEAQETIADARLLQAVAAMFRSGKLPEGQSLEEFYDSQLAAMGNYLFGNRRYRAASETWTLLARRDAASSLFAQAAGQSLFAARQFEQASRHLRQSLVLAKKWKTDEFDISGVNLQDIFSDAEDLAEARATLEVALLRTPKNNGLEFLMAYIDLFHGLWDRADNRLTSLAAGGDEVAAELLKLKKSGRISPMIRRPMRSDQALTLNEFQQIAGRAELTLEERKALVEAVKSPRTYQDYMNRGDFYFFMGSYTKAADAYGTAAGLEPDNVIPKFAECHAAFANGEYSFATKKLKEGLLGEPNIGLYNFRLEEFYSDRKDLDRRLRDLEHLAQLRSDDLDKRFLLAYIYYFDGRYKEAAGLLSRLLAAEPDFEMASHLLKLARLQG